uniref:Putative NADH dehydrogenase n=1 Tax=viral metagenome TaxID=1070528 RepID=A0A6M3KCR5_9ZZZZ
MSKKTVLVTGSDGYLGTALTLRLLEKECEVVGVDNILRREMVKEMGSFSAFPIYDIFKKARELKKIGSFAFFYSDITNYDELANIFKKYKPDIVVNLAQQPSAPYSHISREHAVKTIVNNSVGTMNILYCMKEFTPNSPLVTIGSMGEFQVDINTDIAEGLFEFEYNGRKSKSSIFPRRAGSYYHSSKIASTYYIDCAVRFWGLSATDIMQGVVYGNWTEEIVKYNLNTRLDSDESLGTVINRFIVQAMIEHPLTVYGKGLHKRGFLALNDSIQCLMLAIENPPKKGEYRTWNQLDEVFTIDQLADKVISVGKEFNMNVKKIYIESPRVEVVDDHYYNPIAEKIIKLGFKQTRTVEDEIRYLFKVLLDVPDLKKLGRVVIPKITWR